MQKTSLSCYNLWRDGQVIVMGMSLPFVSDLELELSNVFTMPNSIKLIPRLWLFFKVGAFWTTLDLHSMKVFAHVKFSIYGLPKERF